MFMRIVAKRLALISMLSFVTLASCKDKPTEITQDKKKTVPSTNTSSSNNVPKKPVFEPPQLDPVPNLAQHIRRSKEQGPIVVATRLLTQNIVKEDEVSIFFRLEDHSAAPVMKPHILANKMVDSQQWLNHVKVFITGPDKKTTVHTMDPIPPGRSWKQQLEQRPTFSVLFNKDGVRERPTTPRYPFHGPSVELFPTPGTYQVKIAGKIDFAPAPASVSGSASDFVEYETAEMPVHVLPDSPSHKKLEDIEKVAGTHIASAFALGKPPSLFRPMIEDEKGNRVIRFGIHDDRKMYQATELELIYSPSGDLLSGSSVEYFTCIAFGVHIETPLGPVPVEQLREGDRVFAFDTKQRNKVVTQVRSAMAFDAPHTLQLTPTLQVTPSHPVYADEQFLPAGELAKGAKIQMFSGELHALNEAPTKGPPSKVVQLSVDYPHNYFAGGVLVHNKAAQSAEAARYHRYDWESLDYRVRKTPKK